MRNDVKENYVVAGEVEYSEILSATAITTVYVLSSTSNSNERCSTTSKNWCERIVLETFSDSNWRQNFRMSYATYTSIFATSFDVDFSDKILP